MNATNAASASTTDCRRCGGSLVGQPTFAARLAETFVVFSFAFLHMGLWVGDFFAGAYCLRCRGRVLRWTFPTSLLIVGGMLTAGGVLIWNALRRL